MTVKKICVITGANSGIGRAAATQVTRQGYHVIFACRNPKRGETLISQSIASRCLQSGWMLINIQTFHRF